MQGAQQLTSKVNKRTQSNGFHMLAYPNTCEASFIAIFLPSPCKYFMLRECCSGGPNSTFFDCVLRHYHPQLFLHMWLGSRNVFPQPVLDVTGRFIGTADAGQSWTIPSGWWYSSAHAHNRRLICTRCFLPLIGVFLIFLTNDKKNSHVQESRKSAI